MSAPPPSAQRRGIANWAGLGGVLYVVLFVGGLFLALDGQPDLDAPPREYIEYFGDSGNRDQIGIGWALVTLGAFFFLWFLSSLRETLRRLEPGGFLTNLATVGGVVYAALTLAAAALMTAIQTMSDDTYRDQVFPELIHAAGDAGYVMHASGGVGAAAMMIAGSLVAARAGAIPSWLGWVGVVFGVLAIFSIAFLPQFLIAAWILVAGVLLFLAAPATAAAPAPAPERPPGT